MRQLLTGALAAALGLCLAGPVAAQTRPTPLTLPASEPPLRWNAAAWWSTPTECDRLAAHPSDPDKLVAGVSQAQLLAAGADRAIAACEAAVAADPANPRLNYQLARTLGYSGRGSEAGRYRETAVAGDYPQALFVVGFVHLTGQGAPRDVCRAQGLIRRSGYAGRFAGLTGYPAYVLSGAFDACPGFVRDLAELSAFLQAARPHPENNDYYRGLLIETLTRDVQDAGRAPTRP